MFSLVISLIDALLSVFGLAIIVGLIWGFYEFKTKTLIAGETNFLGYTFNIESTRGKELIFKMKKRK